MVKWVGEGLMLNGTRYLFELSAQLRNEFVGCCAAFFIEFESILSLTVLEHP